jgi:plastocyanin
MHKISLIAAVVLLFYGFALAHDVSGNVQVLLKNDKKKTDLSSVIVYLNQGNGSAGSGAGKKAYTIATANKQFNPHAIAIPAGATVSFPNNDPIFHNIFSVAPKFDLGLSKAGEVKKYTFQEPGIAKIFCNVHPQMSSTIIVTSTPYFTNLDQSGNFLLPNVPAGTYQIRAYADEGQAEQSIQVGSAPMKINLTIDGKNYKAVGHKNKFGKEYSTEDERY